MGYCILRLTGDGWSDELIIQCSFFGRRWSWKLYWLIPEEDCSKGEYDCCFFSAGDDVGGWTGRWLRTAVMMVSVVRNPLMGGSVEADQRRTRMIN